MALVLIEGFDHYDVGDLNAKLWHGLALNMLGGRQGGQSVQLETPFTPIYKYLPSTYSEVVIGAAFYLGGSNDTIMEVMTAAGATIASLHYSGGVLVLRDAAAHNFLGTTSVPSSSWFQIELKLTVGTSGSFELRLNGATEIATTTGNFGSTDVGRLQFDHFGLAPSFTLVDDVYVLDTTGSAPRNDFLGDVIVKTLYPVADGHYSDWTPLTGTDHFAMVDEVELDGDASYIYDTAPGDIDSFTMQGIGVSATVYAAQLNVAARKGDAGLRQIAPLVRQSGTDYVGSTITLSSSYVTYSEMLEQDPTGSDWTPSTLNGDEYGVEVI